MSAPKNSSRSSGSAKKSVKGASSATKGGHNRSAQSNKGKSLSSKGHVKVAEKEATKSNYQRTHGAKYKNGQVGTNKKGNAGLGRSYLESAVGIGVETVCREVACEGLATSAGYCRLHYIKNWKKIKRKEVILQEGKLNQYIEELVAKYPDKYIEAIRQDLASDKDFAKVIYDLDLDEGIEEFDVDSGESMDNIIDTLKRDFDDEGEPGF